MLLSLFHQNSPLQPQQYLIVTHHLSYASNGHFCLCGVQRLKWFFRFSQVGQTAAANRSIGSYLPPCLWRGVPFCDVWLTQVSLSFVCGRRPQACRGLSAMLAVIAPFQNRCSPPDSSTSPRAHCRLTHTKTYLVDPIQLSNGIVSPQKRIDL